MTDFTWSQAWLAVLLVVIAIGVVLAIGIDRRPPMARYIKRRGLPAPSPQAERAVYRWNEKP